MEPITKLLKVGKVVVPLLPTPPQIHWSTPLKVTVLDEAVHEPVFPPVFSICRFPVKLTLFVRGVNVLYELIVNESSVSELVIKLRVAGEAAAFPKIKMLFNVLVASILNDWVDGTAIKPLLKLIVPPVTADVAGCKYRSPKVVPPP